MNIAPRNIAVLGTGIVGRTLATKLAALGHRVGLGARDASNETARGWVTGVGTGAAHGTFADVASRADVLFVCTAGSAALDALASVGAERLDGKIMIDVTNALEHIPNAAPRLSLGPDDSLGEQIQRAYPRTRVVKALSTVNCNVMVDPGRVAGGDHHLLLCGDDGDAKARVTDDLRAWFGWQNILDLGDITAARAIEGYVALWIRLRLALGTSDFNVKLVIGT